MVSQTSDIESEIQELTDRKNQIFYEWIALNKSISFDTELEDSTTENHQKIDDLMMEQRNISQKIMKLYQKIDEMSEVVSFFE
ncbi:MAG: hypothetical protein EAZ85_13680 [Bacteroidetes bacterium]|nr:MAG: hypothetical protein EAZ85_13680 [Bacteroidota bacterium]TAG85021.1 MAG: hypothetical protein EAZ20_16155 [Bacteroidota bacterium]